MLKQLKKILFIFIILSSLLFLNVYAEPNEEEVTTEVEEIVELTHTIEEDDINELELKVTSKTTFKNVLKELGIESYVPKDNFYTIEYKEFDRELTSISLVFNEDLSIEIYKLVEIEVEEDGEMVTTTIEEKTNSELVTYILKERDTKNDLSSKNEELTKSLEERTSEASKFKKLMIFTIVVCVILIVVIIGILIGMNGIKTQNEEFYAEIELLETNVKELEEKNNTLNETIKKKDELLVSLKEKTESSNVYTNKLTQCIAKLNRDLENEKVKYKNTLDNFTSLHEQDLTTIGMAHQKEIKTLKEDYETKIKELENNNKALQKVISKYNG